MYFSSDPIHNLENLIAKNKTKNISIYLLVILALIVLLACLPIITVDISNQSRGIIRAKQDNVPISTIVSGKVTYINLQNNLFIEAGDTLLMVLKDNLKAQHILNDSLLHHAKEEYQDLDNLLQKNTTQINDQSISDDYKRFVFQRQELQSKIDQAQIHYNRYRGLYDKDVVAKAEYETHLYNLKFAKEALQSFVNQQQAQWQHQKHEIETQIKNYISRKDQLVAEINQYVLTAPVSGTLENVLGLQVGSFVNASQTLGAISPNTNLIVENRVTPNDIGLLKIGHEVKFQLDAFNYNQWGMINGKVIEIDKNITIQDNTSFFKVRCSMDTKTITLKNGYSTNVFKGMTLTTRYFITRRSLYDLLFDKVDDWLNPKLIE